MGRTAAFLVARNRSYLIHTFWVMYKPVVLAAFLLVRSERALVADYPTDFARLPCYGKNCLFSQVSARKFGRSFGLIY